MRRTSFLAAVVIASSRRPLLLRRQPAGTPEQIRGTVDELDGHS